MENPRQQDSVAARERIPAIGLPSYISVLLDIFRFSLALTVAAGHWTQKFFQNAWPDQSSLGVAAVGGFFVLSGFAIRLVSYDRQTFNETDYFIARLSRLWSVVLPAIALTIVLDCWSRYVSPQFYDANWGSSYSYAFTRIIANTSFITQLWGMDIKPFSNSPFWSLGYEAGFYLLYGLYMAKRYVSLLGIAIILGPNILFMFPLWISGAIIYDIFFCGGARRTIIRLTLIAAMSELVLICLGLEYPLILSAAFRHGIIIYFEIFKIEPTRVSPLLVNGALISLFGIVSILGALQLSGANPKVPNKFAAAARRMADATFPIYLFHFPIFVLVASLGIYDRNSGTQKVAIFLGILCLIISVTPLTTALKFKLRRGLSRGAHRVQTFAAPKVPGDNKPI